MFGRDGIVYQPATADFHVAMADMLLAGFPVDINGQNIFFDPLEPEQVLIGLPASPNAAGSGYTSPEVVETALDYVILGKDFGGQYQLANPDGYFNFRGLMTWSINWDADNNNEFSENHRAYLDSLDTTDIEHSDDLFATRERILITYRNYPNPFNSTAVISYALSEPSEITINIYDILGRLVEMLVDQQQQAGYHQTVWNTDGYSSGVYFYRIQAGDCTEMREVLLIK